ncbi:MAG: hypothetical protein AABY22_00385 [Nanoarchaeota archaeon]
MKTAKKYKLKFVGSGDEAVYTVKEMLKYMKETRQQAKEEVLEEIKKIEKKNTTAGMLDESGFTDDILALLKEIKK